MSETHGSEAAGPCSCPYCDTTAEEQMPFCTVCGKEVARCPSCRHAVKMEDETCPNCGAVLPETGEKS